MTRVAKKTAGAAPSRSANRTRGEYTLTLGGRPYLLRPSFSAQVAIETALDKSYFELAAAAQVAALRIDHASVIVTELVNAGAEDPMDKISAERAGEMIYEAGMPSIAPVLAVLLIDALSGGRTASGEAKAVATQ
ncbi:MAG TPA: GTA-gp10 family protein [Rhizomicrobium sp.]|nr:GTA-gp10 family protein [Rhizomicrobium sp.]